MKLFELNVNSDKRLTIDGLVVSMVLLSTYHKVSPIDEKERSYQLPDELIPQL